MTDFVIDEMILPERLDGPGGDEFRAMMAMRNEVELHTLGTDAIMATPEAIFPHFVSTPQKGRRHFLVRDRGRIVARGLFSWLTAADAPTAEVMADVLPAHRRRGIGTALFDLQEQLAVELGRRVIRVSVIHTVAEGGERVASPTGFGTLPAGDPGVQFLMSRGYRLEQVVRISSLDLSRAAESLDRLHRVAQEKAGPDYRLVSWIGRTPERWLEQRAGLATAMGTDAPSGELASYVDEWDADRVREHDDRQEGSGRTLFVTAVEHRPTGSLVGYSELGRLDGADQPAVQEDTLVVREHRGHRLGMLLKVANAQFMLEHAPDTALITTFNAEENEPMLRVNVEMGFRPIGAEGEWQKRVSSTGA